MILTLLVSLLAVSLAVTGGLVLTRNIRSRMNVSFFVFAVLAAVWIGFNYFSSNFKTGLLAPLLAYGDFFSGPLLAYSIFNYAAEFYSKVKPRSRVQKIRTPLLVTAVVVSFSTLSPLVVSITEAGSAYEIVYGPLFDLYGLIVAFLSIAAVSLLFLSAHRSKGKLRTQSQLILFGVFSAVALSLFANLLIPALTENQTINLIAGNLSYLGIASLVFVTAYAIVKHRLFDVRLIIARTIGYATTIALFSVIYGVIAFLLVNRVLFEGSSNITLGQELVFTAIAVILALSFSWLRKLVAKLTNFLFYREAYEIQSVIDELSRSIVTSKNLDQLAESYLSINVRILRPEHMTLVVFGKEGNIVQLHRSGLSKGEDTEKESYMEFAQIMKSLPLQSDRILNKDDIRSGTKMAHWFSVLGLELAACLYANDEFIGIVGMGVKSNGGSYSSQDYKLISIGLNEVSLAIQNSLSFEEITAFNITLQKKVEDATHQLRRSNEKLKALDEAKDEFISMASHQLRTPLTSVKGYISMVLEGDVGKVTDKQAELLESAFTSSQRMVYLIADLLNVSRLKTGKFVIEKSKVNLAEIIKGELDQLKETAKSRNIKLVYDAPKNFPVVELDENKIRQVIMNFIDNAIYYTPSGGTIQVKLKSTAKDIQFRVIDDGIGVPEKDQKQLFAKFYRAGNARKARPDGTGLGLFMAKKVIDSQSGKIIFESKEGQGSTFGFTFQR